MVLIIENKHINRNPRMESHCEFKSGIQVSHVPLHAATLYYEDSRYTWIYDYLTRTTILLARGTIM